MEFSHQEERDVIIIVSSINPGEDYYSATAAERHDLFLGSILLGGAANETNCQSGTVSS